MSVPATPALAPEAPVDAGIAAPRWLHAIDTAVIAVLNVMLAVEVLLVFGSTMIRSIFNTSAMMWVDEVSPLFLVNLAFLGGAVSYGRGQFIAITLLVERAPAVWNGILKAFAEWLVIGISLLIGGYSIPLLLANAEEKTLLLGISYMWMTIPITLGSALFVIHAIRGLASRPLGLNLAGLALLALCVVAFLLARPLLAAHTTALYTLLGVGFFALIAAGVPVGFVLATVGIACVMAMGSADMLGVVMNAQRGSGGFIFLALPFFVLAGFIMDKADVGGRIVDFLDSLIGHFKGGLLQVMVVGVYLSSCISGSKAADMATIGIPMNRKLDAHGYEPHERAALLAAAAAMAESVPPSIALILLGSSTSISTGALFIAGLLPAATVAVCLMILVRIRASSSGWKPSPRASAQTIARNGRRAILPLMMPVLLLGGIAAGIGTPTEVSTFAVLYGLALGLMYRRFKWKDMWTVLTGATLLNGMIFFTVSAATIFSWAMTLEGVTIAIASAVAGLGPALFLPAVIVITILMGAVLESFVTIVILAPLLLPVCQQLGINPLQYGIIMTESFGIGSILPPIGIALYVACAICGARVELASRPLFRYLAVMIGGLLLVAFVPWITTVLPVWLNFKF
ncbi:MAG: TRAP transporter large permease subunit [Burkholderiales bacterium]